VSEVCGINNTSSRYKYLNSGQWIGLKDVAILLTKMVIDEQTRKDPIESKNKWHTCKCIRVAGDQSTVSRMYLRGVDIVGIDSQTFIFQLFFISNTHCTSYQQKWSVLQREEKRYIVIYSLY